jgi:signal transduction histidine kinase
MSALVRRIKGSTSVQGADILIALGSAVIQIAGTYFASRRQADRMDLDLLGILILTLGPASLLFRRRFPVAVLWFALGSTLTYLLLDYPRGPIFLALIIALVSAVMSGHRIAAVASLVVGYFSFTWLPSVVGSDPSPTWGSALALAAWLLVLFTVSEIARSRRERAAELAHIRAEEEKRRAGEERLRIARELHDVLAHNISLINVQAGVALHVTEDLPEQARTALTAIKQASGEALAELQSVLEILRTGYESHPRLPTSGLDRLDELVGKTKAAGLNVTTQVVGKPRALPPRVDLAAFRIVQEALTNVTRHAGQARAGVTISYREDELIVQIDDDGRGLVSKRLTGGKGIAGMTERAAALNGELQAGPLDDGGFRVRAILPLPDDGLGGST